MNEKNVKYYEFLTPTAFSDVVDDIKKKRIEGLEIVEETDEGVIVTDGKITFLLMDKSYQKAETNTAFGFMPDVTKEDFIIIEVEQDDDPNDIFTLIEAHYGSQIAFLGG